MAGRRVTDVEVQMAELKKDVLYIKEGVDKLDKRNEEQHIMLEEKFVEAIKEINRRFDNERVESDEKYAPRSILPILKWVLGFVTSILLMVAGILIRG